jgi:hypothetical protein
VAAAGRHVLRAGQEGKGGGGSAAATATTRATATATATGRAPTAPGEWPAAAGRQAAAAPPTRLAVAEAARAGAAPVAAVHAQPRVLRPAVLAPDGVPPARLLHVQLLLALLARPVPGAVAPESSGRRQGSQQDAQRARVRRVACAAPACHLAARGLGSCTGGGRPVQRLWRAARVLAPSRALRAGCRAGACDGRAGAQFCLHGPGVGASACRQRQRQRSWTPCAPPQLLVARAVLGALRTAAALGDGGSTGRLDLLARQQGAAALGQVAGPQHTVETTLAGAPTPRARQTASATATAVSNGARVARPVLHRSGPMPVE